MTQRGPELRWTAAVERSLARTYYADTVTVLYSLLFDPSIDNRIKFPLNHFPYRPGTRALNDGVWYVVYSVDAARNVMVYQMYPRSYIDQLPVMNDPTPP